MADRKPSEKQLKAAAETYWNAKNERLSLEAQAKEQAKIEREAKAILEAGIAPGEVKAGVVHQTQRRVSTKWTDYSKALIGMLPKTKREVAQALKTDYQSEKIISEFKPAEQ